MKSFYEQYFGGQSGEKYVNLKKNFSSYFLKFDAGCRLELMHRPDIPENLNVIENQNLGLIHFAISVGNKTGVDQLTETLRQDDFPLLANPARLVMVTMKA